ncbi:MAG: hypothetical protein AAF657_17205 [Acidobacteriota bacterium]
MTTLLVIGDDRTTLEDIPLPADDYEVELVRNVEEASRVMAERGDAFDAILIDWSVPEVARLDDALPDWVRQHAARDDVEVVVHARTFDPEHIDQVMTSGAYYFLTKPFVPAQLHGIVRAAVTSCRLKREVARNSGRMRSVAGLLGEGHFQIRTPEDADALASYLGAACRDSQQGVGFLELLRNAIEHGNLEITYEEKGALLKAGRFQEEIRHRLEISPYAERYAEVTFNSSPERIEIEITDRGPGFDFERYMIMTPDRMFAPNGRGVLLASICLDIEYFAPGNRVRAVAKR